jgi:uncharacterized membrane protein YbhN (UPF0104 family)
MSLPKLTPRLKLMLALVIIAVTVVAFAYYLATHPETVAQIRRLPPATLVVLLILYAAAFLAYVLITRASLWAYKKMMSRQENLLFNAYSSLINFFGPGQSGPAFRGVYLKKRHGLEVKKYLLITLIYYAFLAILSAFIMFVGSRPWWQTVLLMLAVGGASFVFIRRYQRRAQGSATKGLYAPAIGLLLGATVLQLVLLSAIYYIELHNVGAGASLGQLLAYTGVSNFALFVALTPGAIGIREAFLVFSQGLHGIDASTIVAANVIDRAVYLVFLGLLFVMVISMHAKEKLKVKELEIAQKQKD